MAHPVIGEGSGTVSQGQVKLTNLTTYQKPYYEPKVYNVSEDVAPLIVLMERLKNVVKNIPSPTYNVLKTDMHPTRVTLNGDSGSGASPITLTTGHEKRVKVGDILQNPRTLTEIRVTAVDTGAHTISVTRPQGSTTDGDFVSGDELQIIGNAQAEFSTAPESIITDLTHDQNVMQCFRYALEASRRVLNTDYYGGDPIDRNKKQAAEALRLMEEKTFLFGRGISTTDPTQTGGFLHWVSTNLFAVGGALVEDYLCQTILPQIFMRNHEAPNFCTFIGEKAQIAFSTFGLDAVRYGEDTKILGVKAGAYQSPFGTIKLIKHGVLSEIGSAVTAANTGYQGMMQFMNLDYVGKRVMKGGELKFGEIMMTNGPDGKKWGAIEDCGFFIANEPSHGSASGITG